MLACEFPPENENNKKGAEKELISKFKVSKY